MSLSGGLAPEGGKLGEDALHYANEPIGPEPTPENPAGVYPAASPEPGEKMHHTFRPLPMEKHDELGRDRPDPIPQAVHGQPGMGNPEGGESDPRLVFSNPAMFSEQMMKLSSALSDVIYAIEDESGTGIGAMGRELIHKFKMWRNEVDLMRQGRPVSSPSGQGNVERRGEGGLYTD